MKKWYSLFDKGDILKFVLLNLVVAGTVFMFLVSVNNMLGRVVGGEPAQAHPREMIIYAAIVAAFILLRHLLSKVLIQHTQKRFWTLRMELLGLILKLKYNQFVDKKKQMYAALTRGIDILTNASLNIIQLATSAFLILAALVYMAVVSFPLFLVSILTMASGIGIYLLNWKKHRLKFLQAQDKETEFVECIRYVLEGFKEINAEEMIGKELYERKMRPLASDTKKLNVISYTRFLGNQVTGQVILFILIGAILLYFAHAFGVHRAQLVSFIFILLFLRSEIESVMSALPELLLAGTSVQRLDQFKQMLEKDIRQLNRLNETTSLSFSNTIFFSALWCRTSNEEDFYLEPVNLNISKGETIFISGVRYSGKTTLLKLMMGLLVPDSGNVYMDGKEVFPAVSKIYSEMFSVVFEDEFFFDEVYALSAEKQQVFLNWVDSFGLAGKLTHTDAGNFLASGVTKNQKKQIALAAALAKGKEILFLDEWTTGQPVAIAENFFTRILPVLQQKGITVIITVNSPDYYNAKGTKYKMSYGKLSLATG